MDVHVCLKEYDRRFHRALAERPQRRPWTDEGKAEIRSLAMSCLGIRDAWIPSIQTEVVRTTEHEGFRLEHLTFSSWPGVVGAAHRYLPDAAGEQKLPCVLLCCGHGGHCKLNPIYQAMARHVARQGFIVLVPDNLGQGERAPMGHRQCVTPFACGTTVLGLILLEAMAWLRWAAVDPDVDADRLAVIGNSGGGKMALFLSALCPELAAVSSSGHPTTFEFVARKEKRICHCTIVPGIVGELEMFDLLGCVAPKPLLIFQGESDPLFAVDLFHRVAREVRETYHRVGAAEKFRAEVLPGGHCWDHARIELVGRFLSEALLGTESAPPCQRDEPALDPEDGGLASWPDDALTTDQLAQKLTGVDCPAGKELWEVFPPPVDLVQCEQVTPRGDTRQVLAQFQAFLKPEFRIHMKFAVGYQQAEEGEEDFVAVVRDYREQIAEVYFPWGDMPSGRAPLSSRRGYVRWDAQRRLEEDLEAFREMGIALDLLFNSNCYGGRAVSRFLEHQVASVLDHLGEIVGGVDAVTTTSLAVAHVVKEHFPDVDVRASVNMRIGTIPGMRCVADLFDSYYVQRDCNRDIPHVRRLKSWADANGKKLFMLVNSGCLAHCSGQTFHDNLVAHEQEIDETENISGWRPHVCWNAFRDKRNWPLVLQATWIRPEDLHHYDGLFPVVKLATRMHARPRTVIHAYVERRFRGNLLDLFEPGYAPAFAPHILDNEKFPDDWSEKLSACSRECEACDYCGQVLDQVLTAVAPVE